MLPFYIIIFIFSFCLLFLSSSWLTNSLIKMAHFLNWREFVVAFFVMAFAGALPNFFIALNSMIHQVPQLSLGDIMGGNLVDLTLVVALATLIAKTDLPAESRMVQTSTTFTAVIAILPLILLLDGTLGRIDGLILLMSFGFYISWLFSKEDRFRKVYSDSEEGILKQSKSFFKTLFIIPFSLLLLLIASEGVVRSARYFASSLNLSLPLLGVLIVGVGNSLPETYFAIFSAKKGQNWMILGNLMANIIVPSSMILGLLGLISPFKIPQLSLFLVTRIFLALAAIFFLVVLKTGQRITKKEAYLLLGLYLLFLIVFFLVNSY